MPISTRLLILLFIVGLTATGFYAAFLMTGERASANTPADKQAPMQSAPYLARGSRIPWQDGSYFLSGINYPQYMYYGGDIATLSSVDPDCNWSYSSAFDYRAIDADFAEMQASGVHVVRWWLFGDGRGAPEFDLNRMVTGFDATFFDHMDQAMEIAAHHNIYIIWSLWDFLAFEHGNWLCGGTALGDLYSSIDKLPPEERDALMAHLKIAQSAPEGWVPGSAGQAGGQSCMINAGGHRNLVTDTSAGGAQDSFFNNALIPMLRRYANNRNIIGWEIMNEPEWALNQNEYTGQNPTVQEPVDVSQMRAFFQRFTQAVHAYAPRQYATVGSASLKFMGFGQYLQPGIWSGLGFDYYGAHYYGWMDSSFNNGSPMSIDYNTTQSRLDAPVVIGEMPANGGTAPVYLPSVRRSVTETTSLALRYICTAYAPGGDPPCTRPYTATIEYYNPNGTLSLTQSVVLQPYGGWSGQVPDGAGTFAGAARILSNGPVAAAVTQTGMLWAGEEAAYTGQDQANQTTWLPVVTNLGTHRSRIAVQNPGVHAAAVTVRYYNAAGTAVLTDNFSVPPRGSALVDPLLQGARPGPPAGFQGSAIVIGNRPLIVTAYELDPQLGSDAYNGEGQGYQHAVYLPSVRNSGTGGDPTLYVQNPCCGAAHMTVSYNDSAGTQVASQALTLPEFGSAVVQPQSVLPGGFQGSAIITSDQYPAAVMRSVTTNGSTSTVELYAGTQNPDQRLHLPGIHSPNGSSGQDTTFTVQNVSQSSPITVWLYLNDNSGGTPYFNNSITIPPLGEWTATASSLPGVPAGFNGTAEILWPWPNGWSQGFPLMATALNLDGAHTSGSAYRGIVSHSQYWAVTQYTPGQLLEGIYGKHWAGALAWSFYDQGTGTWDDFHDASDAFDAAHPADVRIGQSIFTPIPTPANSATATALAATNTPAYGNTATATAVAQITGTPQPPCATCSITFSDVHSTDYFYAAVQYLSCAGAISGYSDGTFRPYNNTTRGQLSKIVVLAEGWAIDTHGGPHFSDVPTSNAFYTYIETAYNHNIISGYSDGTFRWGNNVTRAQLSKIVVNAKGWAIDTHGGPHFSDVPSSNAFYTYIETAYNHGIISGYSDGTFRWGNNATRGQIAKIVYNAGQ